MMDRYIMWRRSQGYCGQSIQFGPWTERGMAADLRKVMEGAGFLGLSNDLGIRTVLDVLRNPCVDIIGRISFIGGSLSYLVIQIMQSRSS